VVVTLYASYQYQRESKGLTRRAEEPRFKASDVTFLIPTIDGDDSFPQLVQTWLSYSPHEIIIITPESARNPLHNSLQNISSAKLTLCYESRPGKRFQLAEGIRRVSTELIILVDDDVLWSPLTLQGLLAGFNDPQVGGVGTTHQVRPNNLRSSFTVWEALGASRLTRRNTVIASMMYLSFSNASITLSGRTAAYRSSILQDPTFLATFTEDYWRGKNQLDSGDDNFISKWMQSHKWKARYLAEPEFEVLTTVKSDWKYLQQLMRWLRNATRYRFRGGASGKKKDSEYFWNLLIQTLISNFHNDTWLVFDLVVVTSIVVSQYFGGFPQKKGAQSEDGKFLRRMRSLVLQYLGFNSALELLSDMKHLIRFPGQLKYLLVLATYGHIRCFAIIYAHLSLDQVHLIYSSASNCTLANAHINRRRGVREGA
jgi:cellulose synthase/poly-beta-1,6-N-acetylglucosamine synthase-like glycosyltransferase